MNRLKKILPLVLFFITGSSLASQEQERIYLVQLINQLDAMTPMVLAAAREQPKNLRVQFHYTAWRDDKGQLHNGLLEDINDIKAGIRQKLNDATIESRVINPVLGDYQDKNKSVPATHDDNQ